jgi:arylsulfatase A-like enzyme
MPSRRACLRIAAALSVIALAACTSPGSPEPRASAPAPTAIPARPNVVFVLTDDLSANLVPYMPNVLALQKEGTTFSNFTVTDSLCCPSRASLFTGRFPHNTGIIKNHGKNGGFRLFHARGEETSTFATDLKAAGYRTAFLGKYLNEYQPGAALGAGRTWVPPGWDEWYAGGDAYANLNYDLNENGRVVHYGSRPADYLTDVIGAKAQGFIAASAAAGTPFLVELATYAPHRPFTPAAQDAASFPGLTAPRGPSFDQVPADPPKWLAGHAPLTAEQKTSADAAFRKRVQEVQSVDRMIGALRQSLEKAGAAGRTLVVFSSDNGYHLGEHRLAEGKQTAFDTDVNVPLVVAGPGVPAGRVDPAVVQNIDLRPTFDELAGAPVPAIVDGESFVPLLKGETGTGRVALVEHLDSTNDPADPDFGKYASDIPPTYHALRSESYTYVEYADGSLEYYDHARDPEQLHNVAATLAPARKAALHASLQALKTCHGQACRAASRRP